MTIVPDLSVREYNSLNTLLALIETKLAKVGQLTWEDVAFGIEHKNYKPQYDDLIVYREIITQKLKGCGCYTGISLATLINKIKQLTA